jgi:hypothetical protein
VNRDAKEAPGDQCVDGELRLMILPETTGLQALQYRGPKESKANAINRTVRDPVPHLK